LAFSPAFPRLSPLIPLELCAYVFDLGGADLPMGSVHEVITAATEQRLIENLDPSNKDKRKREEATLQVQRMIVHEEIQHRRSLEPMKLEAERLKKEAEQLRLDIRDLGAKKSDLDQRVRQRESEFKKIGRADAQIEAVRSVYAEEIEDLKSELAKLRERKDVEIAVKDAELASREEKVQSLETEFRGIEATIERLQAAMREEAEKRAEENAEARKSRQIRSTRVRKAVLSALMVFGIAFFALLLLHFEIGLGFLAASTLIGMLGAIAVWTSASAWVTFGLYAISLVIASGAILVKRGESELLWLIPMGWQVGLFFLNRALGKRASD
jgi:hypothetical protein